MQGDNLFQLLGPRYAPNSAAYMLLAALVMIPTVWLPDLKTLSGLGVVGVAATLTVTAAIAYTLISGAADMPPCNHAFNTAEPSLDLVRMFVARKEDTCVQKVLLLGSYCACSQTGRCTGLADLPSEMLDTCSPVQSLQIPR